MFNVQDKYLSLPKGFPIANNTELCSSFIYSLKYQDPVPQGSFLKGRKVTVNSSASYQYMNYRLTTTNTTFPIANNIELCSSYIYTFIHFQFSGSRRRSGIGKGTAKWWQLGIQDPRQFFKSKEVKVQELQITHNQYNVIFSSNITFNIEVIKLLA